MPTDFLTGSGSTRTLEALLDSASHYLRRLPQSHPYFFFAVYHTSRSNYYYKIVCIVPRYIHSLSNVTIVKSMLLRFVDATALGFG